MDRVEVPRNRHDLDNLFAQCVGPALRGEFSEEVLGKLEAVSEGTSLQAVFSVNEDFEDVDTGDLGYVMVDYWIGLGVLRTDKPGPPDPEKRRARLQRAKAQLERFLLRCTKLRIYAENEDSKQETSKVKKPAPSREEKIARFKRKRAAEENLKNVTDTRDRWKFRMEAACMDALDEIDGIERELEILDFMIKEKPHRGEPPKAPEPKPIEVTKVGPSLEITKETFMNGVFKPYHRLPTMTLEEYAELEMQQMEERTKREKEQQSTATLSLNELAEKGLEDEDVLHDAAQEKARKWDDWKDGVPKGSGITKRF